MNYLAHFYLSDNKEGLIIGNYIADDVKGKDFSNYSEEVQKGILLHRKIDDYTDSHDDVFKSKERIREHQRKYSPVVIDVFYDYFLAKNWAIYSEDDLHDFTLNIYKVLFKKISRLPMDSQVRLPFMAKSNWLYNSRKVAGIQKALTGLSKRTSYDNNMDQAHLLLVELEDEFQTDFESFFPDLITHVKQEIILLG